MFRKMLSFIFAALLLFLLVPTITPAALAADEDFVVESNQLIKYVGLDTDITIPSHLGIVMIGRGVLKDINVERLIISEGVRVIADNAFNSLPTLKYVSIPDSVWIMNNSFHTCSALETVVIGNGVTEFVGAFFECSSLKNVTLGSGLKTIGDDAFGDCVSLESIEIPSGVINLGKYAFGGCSLKTLALPEGLKTIGANTFENNPLTTIKIPSSVINVGGNAFRNCAITSVTFEGRHTEIHYMAFNKVPKTMLIRGYTGSTAHDFALSNGYPFESIGEDDGSGTVEVEALIIPSDNIGIFINLTAESITLDGFTVAAYSTDGGGKWKKGALPTGTKFSKLFDKETTLWLCSEVDKKKKPTESAVIVKFPTISARPKAEKLSPYFTETNWFLVKKGSEEKITNGYEFAYTSDKKTAKDGKWYTLDENGFQIGTGKAKTTHLIRSPAKKDGATYTPASKIVKVVPANYGKAPNTKIKSKTKILKLKKGHIFQIDDGPANEVTDKYHEVDFNVYMGEVVAIWKAATGKKPPTEKQKIILNRKG